MITRRTNPAGMPNFIGTQQPFLYDEIKLNLKHDFSKLDVTELKTEFATKGSATDKIQILVKQEACTEEASGEKRERSILIKFKGKEYKGCATVQL